MRGTFQILQAWMRTDPLAALPRLLHGRFYIDFAWEARGYSADFSVPEVTKNLFQERLQVAEQDLLQAIQLDPEDPTPYAYLLMVARGLRRGRAAGQTYFQAATQRDPENFYAHMQMLSLLSEQWGGNFEEMFAFARQVVAQAKPKSMLPAIVISAHIERWIGFTLCAEDPYDGYTKAEKEAKAYVANAEVQSECREMYLRLKEAEVSHSPLALIPAKNLAAFWFYLTKEKDLLRPLIQELGPSRITRLPWEYRSGFAMSTYKDAENLTMAP